MGQKCSCEEVRKVSREKEEKRLPDLPREEKIREEKKQVHSDLLKEEERKKQIQYIEQGKWIKHNCSSHKILLVGEGDFSFALCLARAFGSASNMVATSLDSIVELIRKYEKAMVNVTELQKRGCKVIRGVDATTMIEHSYLQAQKFDRIVFNFPHVGVLGFESRESQIIRNQELVHLFFQNAKKLINEGGEIHVTLKCAGFYLEWNIVTLASLAGLSLVEEAVFCIGDYPNYSNKYGYSSYKCDTGFDWNPSVTYKFRLRSAEPAKKDEPWKWRQSSVRDENRW